MEYRFLLIPNRQNYMQWTCIQHCPNQINHILLIYFCSYVLSKYISFFHMTIAIIYLCCGVWARTLHFEWHVATSHILLLTAIFLCSYNSIHYEITLRHRLQTCYCHIGPNTITVYTMIVMMLHQLSQSLLYIALVNKPSIHSNRYMTCMLIYKTICKLEYEK